MYPIRFEPLYQKTVWGGERIAKKFHRKVAKEPIGESWEIVDREGAMSIVANGPLKGKTLHQLLLEMGEELIGAGQKFDRFPLLLKIIDAKENLSIQVHPDEGTASQLNGEAKSEMWFVLEEGIAYAGLQKDTDEKKFLKAIKGNKADQLLEKLELKRGDAVYIPGGRVHSLCAGCMVYEIQQNSDTTYRLYDWGRKGRDLHLEEGLKAIRWDDHGHPKIPHHHLSSDLHHQLIILVSSPYFVVDRIDIFDQLHIAHIPKTFQIFFCTEGEGKIVVDGNPEPFQPGMTYLVPAASNSIEIIGKCQTLRTRLL